MNRVRSQNHGYTIVETLIFLAVTGALFASAMLMISGQQSKTEFSQAVRDIQSQIQDTANDVSTGYYSNPGNIACSNVGGRPDLSTTGSNTQGTNQDCIFIGRFMQFAPIVTPADPEQVFTYNAVGLRKNSTGPGSREVTSYAETFPTAVAPSTGYPGFPDATQKSNLQGGIKAVKVRYFQAGIPTDVAGFGFMTTFARYPAGSIASGSQTVNIVPLGVPAGSGPAKDPVAFAQDIDNINGGAVVNPDGGVVICLASAATDQYGVITIGANGTSLLPQVSIMDKAVATAPGGVCG